MDKQYIKEHHVVERFVLNQLTEEEHNAFLVYQLMNPAVRKEVQEMRAIGKNFRTQKNLATVSKLAKANNYKKWLLGLLAISIISFVLIWQFPFSPSSEAPTTESTEIIPPSISSEEKTETVPPENIAPAAPKKETPKTNPPTKTPKQKLPKKPRPIAAADLAPNPMLETIIGLQYRGSDVEFEMQTPQKDFQVKSSNGRVALSFSGKLITDESEITDDFQLLLFSNKKVDFEEFKPLIAQEITLEKSAEGGFSFQLEAALVLNPGLYYYMIEDVNSGKPYVVERIFVVGF